MHYSPSIRRIAISTGGSDAPGLNARVRAARRSRWTAWWEVLGIRRGYRGLLHDDMDGELGMVSRARTACAGSPSDAGSADPRCR
jgi:6-phosphofructokinase 1